MKTLKLIDKYFKLLEQDLQQPAAEAPPADATDVSTQPEEPEVEKLTSTGELELIMLALQAFKHIPTEKDLEMISEIERQIGDENPKAIANAIRTTLPTTTTGDEQMINRIDRE